MKVLSRWMREEDIDAEAPERTIAVDVGCTPTEMETSAPCGTNIARKFPTSLENTGALIPAELFSENDLESALVTRFLHGTTIATDAVLERSGGWLGLITTEVFADVLEIGRQMLSGIYPIAASGTGFLQRPLRGRAWRACASHWHAARRYDRDHTFESRPRLPRGDLTARRNCADGRCPQPTSEIAKRPKPYWRERTYGDCLSMERGGR